MPNTTTQLLFHVVFSTKHRERTLPDGKRDALYKYIWGIHSNLNCHLYRIGGVDDHVQQRPPHRGYEPSFEGGGWHLDLWLIGMHPGTHMP
jgi:hypothetical protein